MKMLNGGVGVKINVTKPSLLLKTWNLCTRRYLAARIIRLQVSRILNMKTLLNVVLAICDCGLWCQTDLRLYFNFWLKLQDALLVKLKDESMFLIIWLPSVLLQTGISQPLSQPGGLRISWLITPLQFSAVNWLYALTLGRHSCHGNLICMAQKTPEK